MTAVPQAINVSTQQTDFQRWKTIGVSVQTGMTLKLEASSISDFHEIGVYNCSDLPPAVPAMFPIFTASDNPGVGWYALATFNSTAHTLSVQVFDENSVLQSTDNFSDVDTENFGYYIKNTDNSDVFFTEDKRQLTTDSPQALVFQGQGGFGQGWWLCFEDSAPGGIGSDRDFDDAVIFLESISPTPATKTSWASVKKLFR